MFPLIIIIIPRPVAKIEVATACCSRPVAFTCCSRSVVAEIEDIGAMLSLGRGPILVSLVKALLLD